LIKLISSEATTARADRTAKAKRIAHTYHGGRLPIISSVQQMAPHVCVPPRISGPGRFKFRIASRTALWFFPIHGWAHIANSGYAMCDKQLEDWLIIRFPPGRYRAGIL
jgi:hypothetical protein